MKVELALGHSSMDCQNLLLQGITRCARRPPAHYHDDEGSSRRGGPFASAPSSVARALSTQEATLSIRTNTNNSEQSVPSHVNNKLLYKNISLQPLHTLISSAILHDN